MKRARMVLAEDSVAVARQLRLLLAREFDVVDVVEDGPSLLRAVRDLKPDIVVTDITMPLMSGVEVAERLRLEPDGPRLVFITVHADPALVERAMLYGCCGYVLKSDAGEDLVAVIHSVLAGRASVSSSISALQARGQ